MNITIRRECLRGRNWILMLAAILLSGVVFAEEAPPESPPEAQTVMQAKLAHTRNLIAALVADDFRTLDKEAQEMAAVTRMAAWSKHEFPAYQAESFEFENTLNLLRELARKQNSKGAALACVTLTLSCVQCHKTMRTEGTVTLSDLTVPAVEQHPAGDQLAASAWMRMKLDRTEQALAGLVFEDFEAIEDAANSLERLGGVEAWSRRKAIPRYDMLMASFDYACEQMKSGAREKNIESSTLAYTQLLLSCVNCHAELRAQVP